VGAPLGFGWLFSVVVPQAVTVRRAHAQTTAVRRPDCVGMRRSPATVTACGTTTENSQPKPSGATHRGQVWRRRKYTIGMSQANVAEPYRQRMDDDIGKAAAAVPQFTVNFADAAQDNSKQVEQVDTFLAQRIDLLIISPNEATPLTAPVKRAFDRGIPVLVLDRKVDGDAYTSFIGADNVEIGRQAGQYFAKSLLPSGGKIAVLRGLAGSTPAKERLDGFNDGMKARTSRSWPPRTATGCGIRASSRRTRC